LAPHRSAIGGKADIFGRTHPKNYRCRIYTGQPLQKIEDALERDYFMTAEMAKDFGLVDKVIDKRPEMPPLAVVP
jgi:ATP-dependent protease ClpP protease subunit